MRSFRNLPIKHKLSLIITATSILVMALATSALVVHDIIMFRRGIIKDLSALTEVIGKNSTAALTFNDRKSAEETLAVLKAIPNITFGLIFNKENRPFVTYQRNQGESISFPSRSERIEGHRFSKNRLNYYRPIVLDREIVGAVFIQCDLESMKSRVRWYAGIVLIVMVASSFVAYFLSSRLQGVISRPILHLAETMKSVSNSKEYSIREKKESEDELGVLIDGFNEMLSEIQDRDQTLMDIQFDLLEKAEELEKELIERKRAEEALKELTKGLTRSNQELQQFAYVASHDLQEPLRMVTSYMQLLSKRYKGRLDSDADEFIAFATEGANRMHRLINDLLTYSRVGTRGKELKPTESEKILQQALRNLQVSIEEKRATVTHDHLPTVMADDVQLGQLFQNLIGNAIKFQGEEPPRVHVSASLNDGHWVFSVRDNGIGIAPEFKERIFVIFQRLHNRDKYPGTGIGLAVCKKIVERHEGRIWVESEVGNGATFYFALPTQGEK